MRYATLLAAVLVIAACKADTIHGPGADDPTCQLWQLSSVNGDALPATLQTGQVVTGGRIDLLCTGWYRLSTDVEPPFARVFVGRYDTEGATVHLRGNFDHQPLTGTVSGASLTVSAASGQSSVYALATP